MAINFTSLSGAGAEQSDEIQEQEDRKMFEMDIAVEAQERGKPMRSSAEAKTVAATDAVANPESEANVNDMTEEEQAARAMQAAYAALVRRMEKMDWHYSYSDDSSVRSAGSDDFAELRAELQAFASNNFDAAVKLWAQYAPDDLAKPDFLKVANSSAIENSAVDAGAAPIAQANEVKPSAPKEEPSSDMERELLSLFQNKEPEAAKESNPEGAAPTPSPTPSKEAARAQKKQDTPRQAATQGSTTSAPAGATVGDALGRVVAGAVATPFLALSSAARHLSQTFAKHRASVSALPVTQTDQAKSLSASLGLSASLATVNTLKTITNWKCERIERAVSDNLHAADALRATDEFVVWEESVRRMAADKKIPMTDVVAMMHTEPEFASLKDGMNALWRQHPDKVSAYRKTSDDLERNLRNVIKEFPNSSEQIKNRVMSAMRLAEDKTYNLPGFGENEGEYMRTLAERIKLIVEQITAFVKMLAAKVSGKARSTDLAI